MHILPLSRRQVLAGAAAGAAGLTFSPTLRALQAAIQPVGEGDTAETLAQELFSGLNDEQRGVLAMAHDHPLRAHVGNNWKVVDATLRDILDENQQELTRRVFRLLHHEDQWAGVLNQVQTDNGGNFNRITMAFFGDPEDQENGCELLFAGRHMTRRIELGGQAAAQAFGGPIFYGHAAGAFNEEPDHPGNAYWYQSVKANDLYQALAADQQAEALVDETMREGAHWIDLEAATRGISATDMNADQLALLDETVASLFSPFREADQAHARRLLEANGGVSALSIAYFGNKDLGEDGVWDDWQIKGPGFAWYFRGLPHVHVWARVEEIEAQGAVEAEE